MRFQLQDLPSNIWHMTKAINQNKHDRMLHLSLGHIMSYYNTALTAILGEPHHIGEKMHFCKLITNTMRLYHAGPRCVALGS